MTSVSCHHSFDVYLAAEYGIEEAIIIHHLQHWIRINRELKRNLRDGRTWTYQTHEEISANFPYFSKKQIERLLNKLFEMDVILKNNFNKSKYDRTVWYAFKDEERFVPFIDISRNRDMEVSKSGYENPEIGTPIPDAITDAIKKKKPGPSAPTHPEAATTTFLLIEAIRKTKQDLKMQSFEKMEKQIDKMLRVDGRSVERVVKVIAWLPSSEFWSINILSAKKLREKFDRLELQMMKDMRKKGPQDLSKGLELIKTIEEYLCSHKRDDIEIGADYVDFKGIRDGYYRITEPGFREKVISALRKMGLTKINL